MEFFALVCPEGLLWILTSDALPVRLRLILGLKHPPVLSHIKERNDVVGRISIIVRHSWETCSWLGLQGEVLLKRIAFDFQLLFACPVSIDKVPLEAWTAAGTAWFARVQVSGRVTWAPARDVIKLHLLRLCLGFYSLLIYVQASLSSIFLCI